MTGDQRYDVAGFVGRWTVPIDGQDHTLPVMGVAGSHIAADPVLPYLEFWTWPESTPSLGRQTYRVFGTGEVVPRGYRYVGTAPRTPLGLVWHLFERLDVHDTVVGAVVNEAVATALQRLGDSGSWTDQLTDLQSGELVL